MNINYNHEECELTDLEKQKYIRTKISYNDENFITFMASKKEDGDNIDSWNSLELIQAIREFEGLPLFSEEELIKEALMIKQNLNTWQSFIFNPQKDQQQVDDTVDVPFNLNDIPWDDQPEPQKEEVQPQLLVELSANLKLLEKKNIKENSQLKQIIQPCQLVVQDQLIKEAKYLVFGTQHYFQITSNVGDKIKRTYDECIQLRTLLRNEFPFILIPNLPTLDIDLDDPSKVAQTIATLQNFFDCLCKRSEVFSSENFKAFLKDQQFYRRQQSKISTLDCSISQNKVSLGGSFQAFVQKDLSQIDQVKANLDSFGLHLSHGIKSLEQASSLLMTLGQREDLYYCQKIQDLRNQLFQLSDHLINWIQQLQIQNKNFQQYLLSPFQKIMSTSSMISELETNRKALFQSLENKFLSLNEKKERLFRQDVRNWDLPKLMSDEEISKIKQDKEQAFQYMCMSDQNEYHNTQDMYFCALSLYNQEMVHQVQEYQQFIQDCLQNFALNQLEMEKNVSTIWKAILNQTQIVFEEEKQ